MTAPPDPVGESGGEGATSGEGAASRPCPFCAEPIRPDARKCRHCQSLLADEHGRPYVVGVAAAPGAEAAPQPPPGFWSLMLANLLWPGLGTWRLGRRLRGFLIMAALLLAVLLWAQEAMPLYQKVFNQALQGRANALTAEIREQLDNIIWYKAALVVFIYSFLDVILVQKGY